MRRISDEDQTVENSEQAVQDTRYTILDEETILESGTPVYLSEGRISAVPVNA